MSGNFNLLVSDAPADIEDFESVEVTLSKTKIFSGNDSEESFEEKDINATVDLTEVVGNDSEEVLTTELEAGEYDKIELYVESVDATTTEGEEAEVMVPSKKLQITKPFEVIEGEVTNFVFDINVVKKGQGNDYNLLPVISESGVADETGKLVREEAQGEEAQQAVENVTENAAGNDSEVAGEEAEESEEEVSLDCPGSNPASGSFDVLVEVSIVKKEGSPEPVVEMDGSEGTVSFELDEPFEAKSGVDWYQYDVHIHEGDCDGEEVETLDFRWEDGDQDKSQDFSVPEEGCYCLKISDEDLSIAKGDISMTSGDEFTLPFSTE